MVGVVDGEDGVPGASTGGKFTPVDSRFSKSLILLATYIKTVQVMCEYKGIKCVQHILDMNDHVMLKVISNSDMPMGSCLKQYKFHKRSLDQYINDPRLRRKINKSTQLNLDYVPDGHFNEDVHKLWSYLYSRDLDNT